MLTAGEEGVSENCCCRNLNRFKGGSTGSTATEVPAPDDAAAELLSCSISTDSDDKQEH